MQDPQKRNSKNIVRIAAVSPNDVKDERDILPGVVEELNRGIADTLGLSIELFRWETNAYPGFHEDGPQGLIDRLLKIEDRDLVIGIFWKRFGTPTTNSKSGTEHELRNAWTAWEKNMRPQVMVYFNQEPYNPTSTEEIDQWREVLEFKKHYPEQGLWWSYTGKSEFEKLVRNQITTWLSQEFGEAKETQDTEISETFEAPQFEKRIDRPSLLSSLQSEIETNSVVAIEGLPGSGKSYFVSSYVSALKTSGKISDGIWYDAQEGELLDDFLAQIRTKVRLKGLSAVSKCKHLLNYLHRTNTLLVIDDLHQANEASFSTLVTLAVRYRAPANLLLVSRLYVDLLRNLSQIGHVEVGGFDANEMQAFLYKRQVRGLSQSIIEDLIEKTDGLPLAASLFASLVRPPYERPPKSLLSGTLVNDDRLKEWFDELLMRLDPEERKLLNALSVCDGPFNIWVVQALGRHQKIADIDKTFKSLQRAYLVQRYSPYRWNIHHLIAMFCSSGFDQAVKRDIHLALARYYLRAYRVNRRPQFYSEKEFTAKVRACKQFQLANDYNWSERLIHDIAKTAKTRGYYETLIDLCEVERRENGNHDSWIDYHYAHCCLITGKLKKALEVIERLLYVSSDKSSNKRVAFTRLYAEILGSMGKPKQALDKLREVIAVEKSTVSPNVLSQALSVEVWLLTKLGDIDAAKELGNNLLKQYNQDDGEVGEAVAITRLGVLDQLSGYPEDALKKLNRAIELFRKLKDKRGQAWALSYLATCKLDLDDELGALTSFSECLRIELDINGCSMDYFLVLKELEKKAKDPAILSLAENEIKRVSSALDTLIPVND